MPLNDKKIISIILEECNGVEERCEGYREEIREVIADILKYERDHRLAATNIQQKINDGPSDISGGGFRQESTL